MKEDKPGPSKDANGASMHHGGSFGKYMQYKVNKLQEQFQNHAALPIESSSSLQSELFKGVSVWVNGRTEPTREEIKYLMAIHGGRFEGYYSRQTVTHIICNHLPDAKVKHHAKERNPTPIVRSEWITDSIKAGQRLPHTRYALRQLTTDPGQQLLKTIDSKQVGQEIEKKKQQDNPDRDQELDGSYETAQEEVIDAKEELDSRPESLPQPHAATDAGASYDPHELTAAHTLAAKLRAECDVLRGPVRSTATDPGGGAGFVDNFYKASRLHFIGTWKSRLEGLISQGVARQAPAPLTPGPGRPRTIIHLDMDCFFASVTEAAHSVFRGKPLAVCHSNSARGTGEVSSANYEARKFGITASMFISRAKELCPDLIVVPYDFPRYEDVSEQVYRILLKYTACVQPISCDEAFLDVTGLGDPLAIAAAIRTDIAAATQCTASAGISCNMLLARIATKRAKPNGQLMISPEEALPFLSSLEVSALPGVGWSTQQKLAGMGITQVSHIHAWSKESLQAELGSKGGSALWDFAHGIDDRNVEPLQPRKSIGAEVNWGVRFTTSSDAFTFLESLAGQVHQRARQAGVKGKSITLKVKKAKEGAGEPRKYLGMGICDSLSRSVTLSRFTDASEDIYKETRAMLTALKIPYDQLRGLGIALTKLATGPDGGSSGGGGVKGKHSLAALWGKAGQQSPSTAPLNVITDEDKGVMEVERENIPVKGMQRQQQQQERELPPPPADADDVDNGGEVQKEEKDVSWSNDGWELDEDEDKDEEVANEAVHLPKEAATTIVGVVEGGGYEGEDPLAVEAEKQQLIESFRGTTLTQINAADLAKLPRSVQQELIKMLPRSSKAKEKTTKAAAAAGDFQQQFEAITKSGSGGHIENAAKSLSVQDLPFRDSFSSDSGDAGNDDIDNAESSKAASKAAIPQSFSQIDATVLEALPIALRREVEAAYGIKPTRTVLPMKRPATRDASKSLRQHHNKKRPTNKKERIDSFIIRAPKPGQQGPSSSRGGGATLSAAPLRLSEVDQSVLDALPQDIRKEVLMQLEPSKPRLTKRQKKAEQLSKAKQEVANAAQFVKDLDSLAGHQLSHFEVDTNNNDSNESLPVAVQNFLQTTAGVIGLEEGAIDMHIPGELRGSRQSLHETILQPLEVCLDQLANAYGVNKPPMNLSEPSFHPFQEDTSIPWDSSYSENIGKGLAAVESRLFTLCLSFVKTDLEQTRELLKKVHNLGDTYMFFNATAAKVVEQIQEVVIGRYGLPVSIEQRLLV